MLVSFFMKTNSSKEPRSQTHQFREVLLYIKKGEFFDVSKRRQDYKFSRKKTN